MIKIFGKFLETHFHFHSHFHHVNLSSNFKTFNVDEYFLLQMKLIILAGPKFQMNIFNTVDIGTGMVPIPKLNVLQVCHFVAHVH